MIVRFIALILCVVLASGCIAPTHHARGHVSGDVLSRTGYDLGPPILACDLVFDEWIEWGDGLSEEEAVAVGLWNNPAFQELLADLRITEADIIQAAQLENPRAVSMIPVGPKQWEFALMLPLDVLWLRPLRVSAAELESHRVAERLVQDGLNVVRDIRIAYIDWRLAADRARLAEQGARLRGDVARIAAARLDAGDVAELDVAAVRLDALVGTSEAARADRDAELALQRLRYILGLQLSDIVIEPAPPPARGGTSQNPGELVEPSGAGAGQAEQVEFNVEQLVAEAVAARPDLRAIQLAAGAAEARARLAQRDIWQLTGIIPDINARGRKGFEAGPGVDFSIPLFHQNQGAVARAQADAERLQRQFVNRRDLAAFEVRQAYIQFLQARNDLEIWRDQILPQARAAVTSSQKALEEDSVSLLLVLETTRQLLTAQQREREADAQMRRAIAELERSVGRRLVAGSLDNSAAAEHLPIPHVDTGEDRP